MEEIRTGKEDLERLRYVLAHDLKNPVTTIKNFVGMARWDAAKGDIGRLGKDLDVIEAAAEKMRRLLEDLLSLISVDHRAETPSEVAVGELVREAAAILAGRIHERGVELEVSKNLPTVRGDRAKLLLVFLSLLDNAVKFLGDQPAPRVEVGVRPRVNGQTAEAPVFFVRDNGMGIEPAYHEKVFELFDRLNEEIDGTGVGLALVRRILELHGGGAWVESQGRGRGSTVCFTIGRAGVSPC